MGEAGAVKLGWARIWWGANVSGFRKACEAGGADSGDAQPWGQAGVRKVIAPFDRAGRNMRGKGKAALSQEKRLGAHNQGVGKHVIHVAGGPSRKRYSGGRWFFITIEADNQRRNERAGERGEGFSRKGTGAVWEGKCGGLRTHGSVWWRQKLRNAGLLDRHGALWMMSFRRGGSLVLSVACSKGSAKSHQPRAAGRLYPCFEHLISRRVTWAFSVPSAVI